MDANGILGSLNFPTMAGFNARTFTEAGDKELALVALRAYNDWAIAAGVDVTRKPRAEWKQENEAAGIGLT